jgi:UDP-N-acetylglucosamine--N-acetylmuramyl-(pentapeptide) pyrophosphoryl-undecaprenol N-acetylglucosamine transferase
VYAAADLLVGPAGAGTVNECCHLGLPALFIPLPGASANEQAANARILADAGAAIVLFEAALTPEWLRDSILGLLADRARLKQMGEQARSLAIPDAADRLVALLCDVARAKPRRT